VELISYLYKGLFPWG